ncbi:MAG TPA: peptidoglycan bridge formation glycyltransferase FemA/FemB family protein [Ktedonobacterales bacterium]|nr:peptidoglycan bridge formation glycyltransferase FemA/FemB family protein [Ktedonobacterales bacterium]
MRVEVINDQRQWNAFIESQPTGNITQTFEWAELTSRLDCQTLRLGAIAEATDTPDYEEGALCGALLAIVEQAPILRWPYLYAPRGPVVADPNGPAMAALLVCAQVEAKRVGAFMLKVEPNVPDGDALWLTALARLGFTINPFASHPRRSWTLDIRPDEASLLANMKEKWRYNIRLAGRKGVVVREANPTDEAVFTADLATFYMLYKETADRDGIFIHQQHHYDDFVRLFGARDAAALLIAEYEGTPIAALIVARCGKVATYMFGASSNRERNRMPNHLLQWTAIRWAKAHGCELYDFRAIAEVLEPGEDMYSLYTYKQGFGGESLLTLATHDKVYQPAIYWAYRQTLSVKRALVRRRIAREHQQRDQAQGQTGKAAGADAKSNEKAGVSAPTP